MGVESIISILIASTAALAAFYTSWFQRRELRGKTRAEQDAISTKASNEALAAVQGSLLREVERLDTQVKACQTEVADLRQELEQTKDELAKVAVHRDDLIRELAAGRP